MPARALRPLIGLALVTLLGCAQVRHGIFSRPYLEGEEPPTGGAETGWEQGQLQALEFGGLRLRFDLRNDLRTDETFWVGVEVPILPVSHDGEVDWRAGTGAGPYHLALHVDAQHEGATLRPLDVVLVIDGEAHAAVGADHAVYGEGRVPQHAMGPGEVLELVPHRSHFLRIRFDVERPDPSRTLELQLGRALALPGGERMPDVRFVPARWRTAI